jgi:hypothetical protein
MSTRSYGTSCAGNAIVVFNLLDSTGTTLTVMGAPALGAGAAFELPLGDDSDELHPKTTRVKKDEASHKRFIA